MLEGEIFGAASSTIIGIPIGVIGGYVAIDGASNVTGGAYKAISAIVGDNKGDTANFVKYIYKTVSPQNGEEIYNKTQVVIGIFSVGKGLIELPANSINVFPRTKNIARAEAEGLSTSTFAVNVGNQVVITTKTDNGMILEKIIIDKSKLTNGTLFIGVDKYNTDSSMESLDSK